MAKRGDALQQSLRDLDLDRATERLATAQRDLETSPSPTKERTVASLTARVGSGERMSDLLVKHVACPPGSSTVVCVMSPTTSFCSSRVSAKESQSIGPVLGISMTITPVRSGRPASKTTGSVSFERSVTDHPFGTSIEKGLPGASNPVSSSSSNSLIACALRAPDRAPRRTGSGSPPQ